MARFAYTWQPRHRGALSYAPDSKPSWRARKALLAMSVFVLLCTAVLLTVTHIDRSVVAGDAATHSDASDRVISSGHDAPSVDNEQFQLAQPLTQFFSGPNKVTRLSVALGVADAATRMLADYQASGDCVLADAGYLDLKGRVWSCTVQGAGWVELCMVQGRDDELLSDVTRIRMDAKEWEADLDAGGGL